jgi:hypothetical protein
MRGIPGRRHSQGEDRYVQSFGIRTGKFYHNTLDIMILWKKAFFSSGVMIVSLAKFYILF